MRPGLRLKQRCKAYMNSIELRSITGFAGDNGSGKDTLALTIGNEFTGVPTVGLGDIIKDIATELDMDGDDRAVRRELSRELAEQYHDPAIMAHLALGEYEHITVGGKTIEFGDRYANSNGELYITSIRRLAEAQAIKRRGAVLLWVHAPAELRYERVMRRARGSESSVGSFEDFILKGEVEMFAQDPEDPTQINMSRVFGASDYIYNNPDRTHDELLTNLEETFRLDKRVK